MAALPVLVAWGGVIAKLIVAGIPAGALVAVDAVRRRRDLEPARADVARMGLAISEPREGPMAVRGAYRREAGAEPWLDCGGQHVALDGAVAIVRGTAATWKRGVRTYSLRDGDEVIAIGRMSWRASNAEGGDYREAAGGWRLAPSTDEPAIQLCTARPVACPKPLWPVRGVLVLGLVGAGAYFGLGWLGNRLVALREYPRTALIGDDDVSTFRAELASALPRSREQALNRLAIDLEYRPQTDGVIAERLALARMTSCENAILMAQELGRFDDAVELARDCDHPEHARISLIALGRYDEAAQIAGEPRKLEADVRSLAALATGRWRDAAALVANPRTDGVRCYERYLRSLAGEPIGDLPPSDRTCRVIAGLLAPRDDRAAYFSDPEGDEGLLTANWAFGGIGLGLGFDDHGIEIWLAPHAVDQNSIVTHVRRALLELDLGHVDAATAEVPRVEAINPEWARLLGYVVALRAGTPIPPFEPPAERASDTSSSTRPFEPSVLEDAVAIRGGAFVRDAAHHLTRLPPSCIAAATAALDEAPQGDGLALARLFEHCNNHPLAISIDPLYLFAVVPSVTKHREELATALRNWPLSGSLPFGQVHAFAIKRDLARLLGDDAEASRLQAIIDRHAKVFADRDRITAMFLDQL